MSKSTKYIDVGEKLPGYFTLPSIMHYLIVDPDRPLVIHHARADGDVLATRIVRDGAIELAPPGITLALAEIYASQRGGEDAAATGHCRWRETVRSEARASPAL